MIVASIVIYKTQFKVLQELLDCIFSSAIDRVCIVDNSPVDLISSSLVNISSLEYIHGHGNVGYGAAHNIAIRKSIELGASYHVVINPDIVFNDHVIEELTKYMDSNADVGQLMPKVFYPDGELQYLCKLIPTPMDLIFKRFLPSKLTEKRLHKFQLRFTKYDKIMNIPYLSGCFMFFRVSALKDIGLFDERFFMYPEDIDITRRMHEKYKTIFYPHVSIIHAHAAESKTNSKMLKIHIVNMVKYFNKWGWFFDSKRRKINKKLLAELEYNA
jgi:GT2 family glycosyltransferase